MFKSLKHLQNFAENMNYWAHNKIFVKNKKISSIVQFFMMSLSAINNNNIVHKLIFAKFNQKILFTTEMVRAKELSVAVRAQIMILLKNGYNQCEVARMMCVSRGAVQRCIARTKASDSSDFKSLIRSGRPRSTTPTTDRAIIIMAKRSPKSSSAKIQGQLPVHNRPSTVTIRRRLFQAGLKARKPARKPLLSAKNIRDRISFCRKYRNWSADQWENVMFSDESTFCQFEHFCPIH